MYNGTNHFGRAYQEELLRAAGFEEGRENIGRQQPQNPGLLSRLLNAIFRHRQETQPYNTGSIREPNLSVPR